MGRRAQRLPLTALVARNVARNPFQMSTWRSVVVVVVVVVAVVVVAAAACGGSGGGAGACWRGPP